MLTPPPPVEAQEFERPNLNLQAAVPGVFGVLNVESDSQTEGLPFTVPFTSVDAGEQIVWVLWANFNTDLEPNRAEQQGRLAPDSASLGLGGASGLAEREIQFNWRPDEVQPGCNQITLFVTHDPNFDLNTQRPIDFTKAAVATWWVNVDAPPDSRQTLVNCPTTGR